MIRAFKLAEAVSVFISDPSVKPVAAKVVQYVNIESDPHLWRGWEFTEEDPRGLTIRPPNRLDEALVPWSQVKYVNRRPETKKTSK